jgi:hypothetical protein
MILKKYILIFSILIINLYCTSPLTIDEQIAIIKQAPESKRVELMNQFKRQLILMNQEEREKAISKLKNNTDTNSISKSKIEKHPNSFITNLQQNSIEQQSQIVQDIEIKSHIKENIPIHLMPQTPNIEHPNIPLEHIDIEQPSNIPINNNQQIQEVQTEPIQNSSPTDSSNSPNHTPSEQTPRESIPSSTPNINSNNNIPQPNKIPIQGGNTK